MTLWVAGSNARGQLGTGDEEDSHGLKQVLFDLKGDQRAEPPGIVLEIACGSNHTLALIHAMPQLTVSLWGTGDGSRGQLGLSVSGSSLNVFKRLNLGEALGSHELTMIQASWESSFVVIRSENGDRILSFGSNEFGLLGTGESSLLHGIQDVKIVHLFSNESDAIRVTRLKVGPRNAFAVLRHQTIVGQRDMLVGWGAGRHGQLQMRELNDTTLRGPRQVALPMRVMTWTHPTEVLDLSVGSQHALVLTSDNKIHQLGSNAKHQLPGDLSLGDVCIQRVLCSWNNSFILTQPSPNVWSILSFGEGTYGQLGRDRDISNHSIVLPSLFEVHNVVCGSEHVLVVGKSVSGFV
ncbi:hypothetical protein FRC20_002267 [Serendipita sp. 405]|nr:hypothetical protein FRC20_002267 [Serendipita sp. 405]